MNNLTWKDVVMGVLSIPLFLVVAPIQAIKRKLEERKWRR